jgi:hypothetical protein
MKIQLEYIVFSQILSHSINMISFGLCYKKVLELIKKFAKNYSLSNEKTKEIIRNADETFSMKIRLSKRKSSESEVLFNF